MLLGTLYKLLVLSKPLIMRLVESRIWSLRVRRRWLVLQLHILMRTNYQTFNIFTYHPVRPIPIPFTLSKSIQHHLPSTRKPVLHQTFPIIRIRAIRCSRLSSSVSTVACLSIARGSWRCIECGCRENLRKSIMSISRIIGWAVHALYYYFRHKKYNRSNQYTLQQKIEKVPFAEICFRV